MRYSRKLLRIGSVLFVGLLTGCATTMPPDKPDPVVRLSKEVAHLNRLTSDLTNANNRYRTNSTDMSQRLSGMEQEVRELRGELEVARHSNQRLVEHVATMEQTRAIPPVPLRAEQSNRRPAVDPVAQAEKQARSPVSTAARSPSAIQPAVASAFATKPQASLASAKAVPVNAETPEKMYHAAFLRLKSGQYEQALEGFQKFLKLYPEDELTDNAQYWVGEVHYVQRQFPEALMAFNQVLVRWPGSDKVPASLLKIGFSFFELEDLPNARNSLERLVKDYPESPAVTMAKQRLQAIGRQGVNSHTS